MSKAHRHPTIGGLGEEERTLLGRGPNEIDDLTPEEEELLAHAKPMSDADVKELIPADVQEEVGAALDDYYRDLVGLLVERDGATKLSASPAAYLFAAGDTPRSYATTQVELPGVMAAAVMALAARIPDGILSFDDKGGGGRETRPHVTLRYGIEADDPETVRETIENEGPIAFTLGAVDYFPARDGAPYDVVFVSCWGEGLYRLNRRIQNATPCADLGRPYFPHVTLAYVQPGKGGEYVGDSAVAGLYGQAGDVTFVSSEGTETRIPLRSGAIFHESPEKLGRFFFAVLEPQADDAPTLVELDGVTFVKGKPIHIFPSGKWRAVDGRKVHVSDEDGKTLVRDANARPNEIALTFDHEKDVAKGSKAAGWMRAFEWRSDGLWATDVLWTLPAWEELKAGEWRYLSGDAYGIGDPKKGEAFHPRRLLAVSLVPKPAIPGLTAIALGANEPTRALTNARTTPSPSEGAGKETGPMNKKEVCALLGISEDTPDDEVMGCLKKKLKAGAEPGTSLAALLADEKTLQALGEAVGQRLGASLVDNPAVKDRIAAAASDSAAKAAGDKAAEQVKEQLAARDREALIDATLLGFENAGKILAAEREDYREQFRTHFDRTKKLVEALPKRAPGKGTGQRRADLGAGESGGAVRVFFGAERPGSEIPEKFTVQEFRDFSGPQREAVLSRAAQWAAERGIADFDKALDAVAKGEDLDFRAQLSADAYRPRLRGVVAGEQLDGDFLGWVASKVKSGAIPDSVIPSQIQSFAVQQAFTTIASLQAPTRFTLPIVNGYASGSKIGSLLLPEFAGVGPNGVGDERVSYPKTSTEKFVVLADRPKGDNDLDIPEGNWGVDWTTVDLKFYPYREWAGRRSQAAGNAAGLDVLGRCTANALEILALQKENVQQTYLRSTANWGANYATRTGAAKWDQLDSDPLSDIVGAMLAAWRICGAFPDQAGCGVDPFWALRKNKSLNELAGKYQATKKEPNGLLPIETLIALFGMNWAVSTQLASSIPGGSSPEALWGQDWVCTVTGSGETEAPRFGLTVTSPSTPLVRILADDKRGTNGSDAASVTLGYAIGAGITGAGFLIKDASNKVEIPA